MEKSPEMPKVLQSLHGLINRMTGGTEEEAPKTLEGAQAADKLRGMVNQSLSLSARGRLLIAGQPLTLLEVARLVDRAQVHAEALRRVGSKPELQRRLSDFVDEAARLGRTLTNEFEVQDVARRNPDQDQKRMNWLEAINPEFWGAFASRWSLGARVRKIPGDVYRRCLTLQGAALPDILVAPTLRRLLMRIGEKGAGWTPYRWDAIEAVLEAAEPAEPAMFSDTVIKTPERDSRRLNLLDAHACGDGFLLLCNHLEAKKAGQVEAPNSWGFHTIPAGDTEHMIREATRGMAVSFTIRGAVDRAMELEAGYINDKRTSEDRRTEEGGTS